LSVIGKWGVVAGRELEGRLSTIDDKPSTIRDDRLSLAADFRYSGRSNPA
jgi:hypothetical protein